MIMNVSAISFIFYLYFLTEKRNNNKLLITLFLLETYKNFKKSVNFRSRIVSNNFQLSGASSLRRMALRLGSGLAGRFVIIRFARSPFDSSTSLRRPSSVARQPLTRDVSLYDGGGGG